MIMNVCCEDAGVNRDLNLSTTFEFKASRNPRAVGPSGWRLLVQILCAKWLSFTNTFSFWGDKIHLRQYTDYKYNFVCRPENKGF